MPAEEVLAATKRLRSVAKLLAVASEPRARGTAAPHAHLDNDGYEPGDDNAIALGAMSLR